jgi:alcohol dehydrogenase class IV
MAEGIAVEGMRLVFQYLPRAVADGSDIEARANMMAAAAMGATAFQKGLGVVHSLSHPVGALYNTHHGMTNGVFMPYVLAFNRPAVEAKIARLAAWLGIGGGFDGFQAKLLDLRKRTGVPHTVRELGIDDFLDDKIAIMAVDDPSTGGNPVPFDVTASLRLFKAAYRGDLPAA